MIAFIKSILAKSFWPLFFTYGLILIFLIFQFFKTKNATGEKLMYEQGYAILMIPTGFILIAGSLCKLWGMHKMANWVLALPVSLILLYFLFTLITMIFLAGVFIIFGKS